MNGLNNTIEDICRSLADLTEQSRQRTESLQRLNRELEEIIRKLKENNNNNHLTK